MEKDMSYGEKAVDLLSWWFLPRAEQVQCFLRSECYAFLQYRYCSPSGLNPKVNEA